MTRSALLNYYTDNAGTLFARYQSLDSGVVHAPWCKLLPQQAGLACDIGAGSGRDACWLAAKGWDVVAVEPCRALREPGETYSTSCAFQTGGVTWLDDKLPHLNKLRALDQRFQLILISAVWMHLPPTQHARAMRIVSDLLAPGGILVVSLRHGPDDGHRFHPFSTNELIQHAQHRALVPELRRENTPDSGRRDITWDTLVFRLPDDGTGSLPLLRHIIVNDSMSSSYKLGLLRALIRIAENAPGMVTRRTDDWVEIPFGLVGLYWLKLYMPLVLKHNMIQAPGADHAQHTGYGWAKDNFYSLQDLSPYDLRIGAGFDRDTAPRVIGAIRDACRNIKQMPAHFITWPGQNRQVFACETAPVRRHNSHWQINKETLQGFGTFCIPSALWQCFSQYACWLEPALLNEWVSLMQGWNRQYDLSVYDRALQWDEGKRDTMGVRDRIKLLQEQGQPVHCVWTHRKLSNEKYAVDHCFPWSRWFNNDLWNLMPATEQANMAKGNKLPSAPQLQQSKDAILQWWHKAWLEEEHLSRQFYMEAEAALPLVEQGSDKMELVFHALQHQRAKLKASQQLAEWIHR
ncbi:MAG: class I SAM-dependent methyltransferase [Pseudomonadales bacterium]|nr:class I SAM-dependent methyltransferase [Pseudomonadales bacterium]